MTAPERVDELLALNEKLGNQVRTLTAFYDKHCGTPCEQIRHKEEVDKLNECIETLTGRIELLQDQVEALEDRLLEKGETD